MHALSVRNLGLQLPTGKWLISELSFTVEPGQVLALMGPSGCGKSSLLSWLTGTLSPSLCASGEVRLGPRELTYLPTEKRRLGLMLQQDYLFPHMSVGDNLHFGLRGGNRRERERRVRDSLADASLAGMEHRDPATLSGGQRARVSLIRTLLSDPCALLLDEPFSGLDSALREQIRQFTWQAASQLPVVLVTHDEADIPACAEVLDLGSRVVRTDSAELQSCQRMPR